MRAGAGVLILVSGVVIALIARFAWRLWLLDAPAPHKGVPYDGGVPYGRGAPYDKGVFYDKGVPYDKGIPCDSAVAEP